MLTYFLIGVAIGALTGVPIGPVNVAVIDGAYRHTLRRGMAVGLGGARALRSMLFGVGTGDPLVLAGAATVLVVTALVACYIPALRASAVDPARTLAEQ